MTGVSVEEYKRSSFKATFLPVKESYKINDSVKVKGLVKSFSGYGLSQARVIYHVTRSQANINIYRGFSSYRYLQPAMTEIKTDTLKTDDQGSFQITFKAIPKANADLKAIFYIYSITMEAMDGSGETRSANTVVSVANNNITLKASIPEEYNAQDSSQIVAGIQNLNGQPQKGSVRLQIFALQSQSNLVKNSYGKCPISLSWIKMNSKQPSPTMPIAMKMISRRGHGDNRFAIPLFRSTIPPSPTSTCGH
jgi:hypothetical protein